MDILRNNETIKIVITIIECLLIERSTYLYIKHLIVIYVSTIDIQIASKLKIINFEGY